MGALCVAGPKAGEQEKNEYDAVVAALAEDRLSVIGPPQVRNVLPTPAIHVHAAFVPQIKEILKCFQLVREKEAQQYREVGSLWKLTVSAVRHEARKRSP